MNVKAGDLVDIRPFVVTFPADRVGHTDRSSARHRTGLVMSLKHIDRQVLVLIEGRVYWMYIIDAHVIASSEDPDET